MDVGGGPWLLFSYVTAVVNTFHRTIYVSNLPFLIIHMRIIRRTNLPPMVDTEVLSTNNVETILRQAEGTVTDADLRCSLTQQSLHLPTWATPT